MALSLQARKNIRDAEPKLAQALETIEKAVGHPFTFEVDFAVLLASHPSMSESQKNDIGNLIYGDYARGISSFCQNQLQKEAVSELASARKITFAIIPDKKTWDVNRNGNPSNYNRSRLVDGTIALEVLKDGWLSNVSDIRNNMLYTFAGSPPLTLAVRKNIADNANKLVEAQTRLETATGVKFDVEIDFAAVITSHATMSESQKNDIGNLVYNEYLGNFASGVADFCRHPLQKEAVLDLATARKITFAIVADKKEWEKTATSNKHRYLRSRLVDGVIILEALKESWCSNTSDIRANLVHTFAGTPPMTLAVRKNIFDAAQKLEDVIQRFETATGLKFDVEIDFAALLASHATMSDSQKEQIGDLIYGEYLKDLSYGMVEFCKKPLQKEAVVELATARKITFAIISDKKIWDQTTEGNKHRYLRTRLVDGAIACEVLKESWCSNVSDIRSNLIGTFSGDTVNGLSLACRLDIANHEDKINSCLEDLAKASGVQLEVEADYMALRSSILKRNYDDSLGEFVYNYVAPLTRCLKAACEKDEMNKEAMSELATTKKIKFHVFKTSKDYKAAANIGSSYGRLRLVQGDLVVELNNESLYSNVDSIVKFDETFSGL